MPDILLIQPPIRDFYLTAKRTIPYGLACIASALIRDGFSVEIMDALATSRSRGIPLPDEMAYLGEFYGKPDVSPFALFHHFKHFGAGFERIGHAARDSGAFLVGISSLFTAYSEEALETARIVRSFHPTCKIVMGGHHPTEMPERVMECEAVDYVIRGEGEVSLPALAKALKEGSGIEAVPGLVRRLADGSIGSPPPALMENPGDYPLPAVHLLNQRFYRRGQRPGAVIVASRGCPLRCTYCSVGASSYLRYRRRTVESVLREIEQAVVHHGAGFIDFEDENISLERNWFMELLHGIEERCGAASPELRAMNGLFPPTLDDEMIRTMREAGFRTLNLSLGTTAQQQLKRFNRPDVRESFDAALSCAEKHGLEAVGYIIVGAPGQNPMDSVSDLLYLAKRRVLAGVSVYYPSPGSIEYRRCAEAGILPQRLFLMRSTAIPISHTTTREESVTLLRLGRILNFIKFLLEKGDTIPPLCEAVEGNVGETRDRTAIGKMLLSWFLHDTVIRGVIPKGEVFEHRTSRQLSAKFVSGLF